MTVSSLSPDRYGIDISVKILEPVMALTLRDGHKTVHVSEQLVGDTTGCIILKVTQDMSSFKDKTIYVRDAYTEVIDGFLRLVSDTVEPLPNVDIDVNTTNNLSLTKFVRKI
ncbi:hypothetical protein BX666DRAFT_2021999 [Dichotomocladium elegans]|nr:hypothetical protein BX666DRAFT_2021999 [Dichotomocladium elegans]